MQLLTQQSKKMFLSKYNKIILKVEKNHNLIRREREREEHEFVFPSTETYKSKISASTADVTWFKIKTISSVSRRRFVSVPNRNAWGISWVQNSNTLVRLHERSNITLHFLCWNSNTCKDDLQQLHDLWKRMIRKFIRFNIREGGGGWGGGEEENLHLHKNE